MRPDHRVAGEVDHSRALRYPVRAGLDALDPLSSHEDELVPADLAALHVDQATRADRHQRLCQSGAGRG